MGSGPQRNNRRGRRGVNKKGKVTHCWDCGFQSQRAFNVIRHHERIHGPPKREVTCCGRIFPNKGRFYQHCANRHPETRKSSAVSTIKYKITRTVEKARDKERARLRRSLRLVKPKVENEDLSYFDEDTPLINFTKNYKVIKKEKDIKFEDCHELDLDCIRILFKGDAKSPLHAKIQREFLRFIDFESFKLA